jgi:peroxiredoxin
MDRLEEVAMRVNWSEKIKINPVVFKIASVFILVLLLVLAVVFILRINAANQTEASIDAGDIAQAFTLKDVQGQKYSLDDMKDKTLLISFINTQEEFTVGNVSNNRGEVNFLKSIYKQYASKGLKIYIVDSSYLDTKKNADNDKLINFAYDWELETIPLLVDKKSFKLSKKYNVKSLPTTILINEDGIINQRWDGFALTSQLALAVENLVGDPEYRDDSKNGEISKKEEDSNVDDGQNNQLSSEGDTPSMAKFPGMLPARMLSQEIWLVDGGKPWKSDGEYPIRFLVLSENTTCTIEVTVENIKTGEINKIITRKEMEAVPSEEKEGLLTNFEIKDTHLHQLDTSVIIEKSGVYKINASVYKDVKATNPLYTGEGQITVK